MSKPLISFLISVWLLFSVAKAQLFHSGFLPSGIFADVNVGVRAAGGRVSNDAQLKSGFHADFGLGYMFGSVLGLKADFGFDTYSARHAAHGSPDNSFAFRANIQGVISISDLANFSSESFRLLIHGGPGISALANRRYINSVKDIEGALTDPGFPGSDDMGNFVLGITPQFTLSDAFSFCVDVSPVFLFRQSHYIDRTYTPLFIGQNNSVMLNASVGIQYRLVVGKKIRFGSRTYYQRR